MGSPHETPDSGSPRPRLSTGAVATLVCGLLVLGSAIFFTPGLHCTSTASPTATLLLLSGFAVLVLGHSVRARIGRSQGGLRGGKLAGAGLFCAYLSIIFVARYAVLLQPISDPGRRTVDGSNLRQIGQASLVFANDHEGKLPPVHFEAPDGEERLTTIHDVAFLLALYGGLNDPTMWFSPSDASAGDFRSLTTVLNDERDGLDPEFAESDGIAFDYVTGLDWDDPRSTPIAWTRGLQEDGTWSRDGVYGRDGGHIVFLGGNVEFYRNLGSRRGEDRLAAYEGHRTSNILETLPPGTRVVGAGPASLDGMAPPGNDSSR